MSTTYVAGRVCSALAALWLVLGVALAGPQQADDPFSEANQRAAGSAASKPPEPPVAPAAKRNPTAERIDFQVAVTPPQARRGETVQLTITGIPRPGFHTYPLTQRAPDQDLVQLSKLTYEATPGLQPLWPVKESPPRLVIVKELNTSVLEHKEKFTWTQDLLVLPDATPGPKELRFRLELQACDERSCVQGTQAFTTTVDVSDAPAVALTPQQQERLQAKPPPIAVVTAPAAPPAAGPSAVKTAGPVTGVAPKAGDKDLLSFLFNGILWGAISLVTPCVFPMIPITVSFFLKQSEKKQHRPLTLAIVYSITIVSVLTLGGVLLMGTLQDFSQHWATNVVLGWLFLVFALSLFGMYEIQLPTGLAQFTSAREGQGGLVGTIFMALTFTIISFTCVAPFYGSFIALSAAASSAGDWAKLVLGALAYSVTFALPFFVLALFPSLLRSLPRSGTWMNTVKVVMGFLEVAAAVKFLRAGELLFTGAAQFLTYDLALGIYVALALLCGLYLLGLYRLPHDEPLEHLSVPRLLFSLLFLSLGLYLLPGLFKNANGEAQRPNGTVFAWLDSFLLPDAAEVGEELPRTSVARAGANGERDSGRLRWLGNLDRGLEEARDKRKLVFIDFTGLG